MPRQRESSSRLVQCGRANPTFVNNQITTSKYTYYNFLFYFLFNQLKRYSNIFFLFIAVCQQLPEVSPTGKYTTAVPLFIILFVSAIKEIYEDQNRRRSDTVVNGTLTTLVAEGKRDPLEWQHVTVGNILLIQEDEEFPADCLLLSTSDPGGLVYIQTATLDGETSLKTRRPAHLTSKRSDEASFETLSATIDAPPPNNDINVFDGGFTVGGEKSVIKLANVVWRGSILKNTTYVYCCVIYSGHDTKLLQNMAAVNIKLSTIDHATNMRIIFLLGTLVTLALLSAIGLKIFSHDDRIADAWYLDTFKSQFFLYELLTFFILYNNLIPISLQITLEIVRFVQAYYITNDEQLYDPMTDTNAVARTSNLNEVLGQVDYVLSDKTGTLTKNVMKFIYLTVLGNTYHVDETTSKIDETFVVDMNASDANKQQVCHMLKNMALCHSVNPAVVNNEIHFLGTSPDETELVHAADNLGVSLKTRYMETITIDVFGALESYELLHTIEFNSDRKRMSVILKDSSGQLLLYAKGADSEILKRVTNENPTLKESTEKNLLDYSKQGHRTLCFAWKPLSPELVNSWVPRYTNALAAVPKNEAVIEALEAEVECDLKLIGGTAIEDKLQDNVPETIKALKEAEMKVWILTGDKKETAMHISQSSAVVDKDTRFYSMDDPSDFDRLPFELQANHITEYALLIDGTMIANFEHFETKHRDVLFEASGIVFYRMTPSQKATVVNFVRDFSGKVVLAVGDGGNDVAMIQAAHVGVGINGLESQQAASASDYSIAQFQFLRRLLLVHGTWNYERNSNVILYSFYKNICLYLIEFWYAFHSAFSGTTVFERWTIAMFNVMFTALPPIFLGVFDCIAPADFLLANPKCYKQVNRFAFSFPVFLKWIFLSVIHSFTLYFLGYLIFRDEMLWNDGLVGGFLTLGNAIYSGVVIAVSAKVLFEAHIWTTPLVLGCAGSVLLWFLVLIIYSLFWPTIPFGPDMYDQAFMLFSSIRFWLSCFIFPVVLFFDGIIKSIEFFFAYGTTKVTILLPCIQSHYRRTISGDSEMLATGVSSNVDGENDRPALNYGAVDGRNNYHGRSAENGALISQTGDGG